MGTGSAPGGESAPESGGGGCLLVVVGLGVGEAASVVDGDVDESVAGPTLLGLLAWVARPRVRQPPSWGISAIFLMSTWISSPGVSR